MCLLFMDFNVSTAIHSHLAATKPKLNKFDLHYIHSWFFLVFCMGILVTSVFRTQFYLERERRTLEKVEDKGSCAHQTTQRIQSIRHGDT